MGGGGGGGVTNPIPSPSTAQIPASRQNFVPDPIPSVTKFHSPAFMVKKLPSFGILLSALNITAETRHRCKIAFFLATQPSHIQTTDYLFKTFASAGLDKI